MEDHELLCVLEGVNSMSDRNCGLTLHHMIQRVLHFLFVCGIKGRCCFVQEKNMRLSEDSPCNGYSLFLSSWDVWTFHSNILIKPFAIKFLLFSFFFLILFIIITFLLLLFLFLRLFLGFYFFNYIIFRVEIRFICCCNDFFFGYISLVIFDVLSNSIIEKDRFLTHNSQTGSQMMNIIIFDILSIKNYFSLIWIIKSL